MKIKEKVMDFVSDHSTEIIIGSGIVLSACYGFYVGRTVERCIFINGWAKVLEADPELYPRVMNATDKAIALSK